MLKTPSEHRLIKVYDGPKSAKDKGKQHCYHNKIEGTSAVPPQQDPLTRQQPGCSKYHNRYINKSYPPVMLFIQKKRTAVYYSKSDKHPSGPGFNEQNDDSANQK